MLTRRTLTAAALATPFAARIARAQIAAPIIVGRLAAIPILDGTFALSLDYIPDAKNPEGEALLAAYKGRTRLVNGAVDLVPGMTAMPLPGHTPGHMGVMLTDGSERMLIWGDIIHSTALQLPNPAWTVVFDVDPAMAAATRARILNVVAADKLRVAGMHMATAGRIERRAKGYALVA